MHYDYLLLDADNTLFDFDKAEREALSSLLHEWKIPDTPELTQKYHAVNRALWEALERGEMDQKTLQATRFTRFLADNQLPGDGIAMNARYLELLALKSTLYPDSMQVLQALKGKIKMALCTNGIGVVQRARASRCGIESFFLQLFISGEMGVAKPDPAYFSQVREELGIAQSDRVLMVGDSLTGDMKGGMLAGLDTCWLNPDHKENTLHLPVTYEISRLPQLLDLLDLPHVQATPGLVAGAKQTKSQGRQNLEK